MTIEIKIIVDKSLYINFVCLRSFNKTENTYDQIDECQSILHNTKNIRLCRKFLSKTQSGVRFVVKRAPKACSAERVTASARQDLCCR